MEFNEQKRYTLAHRHTYSIHLYIVKTPKKNFDIEQFKCLVLFFSTSFSKKLKSRHFFDHVTPFTFLSGNLEYSDLFFARIHLSVYCPVLPVCLVLSCLIENCTVCVHTHRTSQKNLLRRILYIC